MFYALTEKEVKKVDLNDINDDTISVGYLTKEELEVNIDHLKINANVIRDCMADQTHFRNSIDMYDDFSFGIINIIDVMNVRGPRDRMAFLIRKNQFLMIKIVDEDDSCKEMFENAIGRFTQNVTIEKVVFGILERLLYNGSKSLEIMEKKIMDMEKNLVIGKLGKDLNRDIFRLRKELSITKNYYEHLCNIGEELQENENELFSEQYLRYFKIFADKALRLSNNTQTLSESLIHLREALDATLNYSLNRIMKVFTVVTTVFLPLTLIVGWYGMNFKYMPELTWKYGYLFVIVLSILVASICIYFFKKKKFM